MLTQKQRFIILFAFLASLYGLFEYFGLRQNFSLEYIRNIMEANFYTGIVVFILAFCAGNLVQLPGWIFLVAAVLTMGKLWGGLVTYVGALASCTFTFYVIRAIGGDGLRHIKNEKVQKIFARLDSHPIRSIFLLRVFFQTAPPMNYALAMSGIKSRHHLLGSMAGLPVPITIHCIFFDFLVQHVFKLA